jgi:hypothetical protein
MQATPEGGGEVLWGRNEIISKLKIEKEKQEEEEEDEEGEKGGGRREYIVDGGGGSLTYKIKRGKRKFKEAIRSTTTFCSLQFSFSFDGTNGLLSWEYKVQNSSCPLEIETYSLPKSELRFVSTTPAFRVRGS